MTTRFCALPALCLTLLYLSPRAMASGPALPMPIAQYGAVLQRVEILSQAAAGGDSAAGDAAVRELSNYSIAPINVGASDLVMADNRSLLAQMQIAQSARPQFQSIDWKGIASELSMLATDLPSRSFVADRSSEASIRTLLSTEEFSSTPITQKSIWDRMIESLGKWIDRIMRRLYGTGSVHTPQWVSQVVPDVILVVVIVIALGLIAYLTVLIVRHRRSAPVSVGSDSALALTGEEREMVAAHNYQGLADLAAEAGRRADFRSAYRLMFLAVLVFLDAEGAIRLDRSKTNWEYLRALTAQGDVQSLLRPLVRRFDQIWYGQHEADASDYDIVVAAFDSVRRIVQEPRLDQSGRGSPRGAMEAH